MAFLNKHANRIEILDRTIQLVRERMADHTFRVMVDRDTMAQLYNESPPNFFEFADGAMRYNDVPLIRNDYIDGIWVMFN